MNNPKDKAKELIEKYRLINYDLDDTESHKEGALIAVDEILELKLIEDKDLQETTKAYWKEVKTIITNY